MSSDSSFGQENEDLGGEFCSGYMDDMGKWNNGFYCPGESTAEQFCCGTVALKYCCPQREQKKIVTEQFSSLSLFFGIVFGVVAAIILVTTVSCYFCSCCVLYRKRQPPPNDGSFYQMHCSSTASGVANMYSFTNPHSIASTPLDSAVSSSHLLVDLEPVASQTQVPNESQPTMARVHTFSRDSCFTDINDLTELSSRTTHQISDTSGIKSTEPQTTYDSSSNLSTRCDQVGVLSHDTCFNQQTSNLVNSPHPSSASRSCTASCVMTTIQNSGADQTESQLLSCLWVLTSDGVSVNTEDFISNTSFGTTFNPTTTTEPSNEHNTESSSSLSHSALLSELDKQSVTSEIQKGDENLYHSTKF